MHAPTTLTHTRFMRWLSSRHLLFLVALVGLAALVASPGLNIFRPAKRRPCLREDLWLRPGAMPVVTPA